jgi:hypothetical protein
MKLTYRDLYTLTSREIDKKLQNIPTAGYENQLSRTSVAPLTSSSLVDVSVGELINAVQDLLTDTIEARIIEGLTVEATDPASLSVVIKAGTGTAAGKLYTLEDDVTLAIPLDGYNQVYFINLYLDRILVDTEMDNSKLTIAKIIVPVAGRTPAIVNNNDNTWNAYIINYTTYFLHGDANGRFEEDTVELLRDNIGELLADNLIGNLRLSENLHITNTAGTLELNSNSLILRDAASQNVMAKLNQNGVFFNRSDGVELAKFSTTGARIGNIVIDPTSLTSGNYVAGIAGFKIGDDGNAEFNDVTVRGTIYATAGDIGGWTLGDNELYATTTGTIKTGLNVGMGYNGVIMDKDGIRVYDDVLGCVVNLPSDGSAPTFSSGTITSVTWELDTVSVIRTSDTVGDGSADSAGILINNTGLYGCESEQTLANANLKILATGDAYFRGEINAISGTIGGVAISDDRLTGGLIIGSTIRGAVIENSATMPKILINESGVCYQVTDLVGKYDTFMYNNGTSGFDEWKYGAGVLGYLFNNKYPPLAILAESTKADIRLYNRADVPGADTGPHEIGDLICVSGELKICSVPGSPGTFKTVGGNVLENLMADPASPEVGQIWIRVD